MLVFKQQSPPTHKVERAMKNLGERATKSFANGQRRVSKNMLQATAETTRNTANRSVNPAAQAPSIRQFPHERRQKRAATVCRSDTKRGASCRCCPPPYSGPERRAADVTGLDDIVLAVVMTCFNRTTLTSRCIESLKACELPNKIKFRVYLTDDGCTDDTAAKALELCPDAVISKGDGSLYWCGGMRLSMQAALADGADFVLWLNDDVVLDPGAINAAWQTYKSGSKSSIVIGSTVDPSTGTLNYGGLKPRGQWGVRTMSVIDPRIESQYSIVDPTKQAHCETMAGQFVLIPRAVALKVAQIEPLFTH